MKIYLLEEVYFEGIDTTDGERLEIRLTDGFWANKRKLSFAKKRIKVFLNKDWELSETVFELNVKKNQKYLYVLNHEYSLLDGSCFYYQFDPQTSAKKCMQQKQSLLQSEKYKTRDERIYDKRTKGWFIEKYKIVF